MAGGACAGRETLAIGLEHKGHTPVHSGFRERHRATALARRPEGFVCEAHLRFRVRDRGRASVRVGASVRVRVRVRVRLAGQNGRYDKQA